jgi:DNA-binding transcriptional LysR family regulator
MMSNVYGSSIMTARYHSLPNLSDFDLRLLRVFMAVVHNKGFASAQDELGISQSTISIQIRQLEERLNVRLCNRGRKGFSLTGEGEVVLEAAQSLFRAVDNFRGLVGSARGQLMGEVHFGIVDAMVSNREIALDRAIAEFVQMAPEVTLNVDISSPQELQQGVIEERYHAILSPVSSPQTTVHFLPIFNEQQGLYCGRSHPLFHLPTDSISIQTLTHTAYAGRSYMRDWTPPFEIEFRHHAVASHMESIALMILSGEMVGYLPKHFAASWVERGEMRIILDDRLSYSERFYLAYRKSERNRTAQAFIECLKRKLCTIT